MSYFQTDIFKGTETRKFRKWIKKKHKKLNRYKPNERRGGERVSKG